MEDRASIQERMGLQFLLGKAVVAALKNISFTSHAHITGTLTVDIDRDVTVVKVDESLTSQHNQTALSNGENGIDLVIGQHGNADTLLKPINEYRVHNTTQEGSLFISSDQHLFQTEFPIAMESTNMPCKQVEKTERNNLIDELDVNIENEHNGIVGFSDINFTATKKSSRLSNLQSASLTETVDSDNSEPSGLTDTKTLVQENKDEFIQQLISYAKESGISKTVEKLIQHVETAGSGSRKEQGDTGVKQEVNESDHDVYSPEEVTDEGSEEEWKLSDERQIGKRKRGRPPKSRKSKKKIKPKQVKPPKTRAAPAQQTVPQEHRVVDGMKAGKFHCAHCDYTTDHSGHYRDHLNRHKGLKPHQCKQCDKSFLRPDDLKRHEKRHAETSEYTCTDCDEIFKKRVEFKRHIREQHPGRSYNCDLCRRIFVCHDDLQKHMEEVHNHICSICGESFSKMAELKKHRVKLHAEDVLKCHLCGRTCPNRSALYKHILRHNKDKKFVCEECGKAFTSQSTLYHHRRGLHSSEDNKPFHCKLCLKKFNFSNSLKLHMLRHKGERPYKCELCVKTYLTSCHLKNHIQAVHTNEKKYQCSTCGKSFPYENSLKLHMMLHQEERPFKCGICDRGFVSKSALKVHEGTHEIKNVECEICGKFFKSDHLLRAHRRRHTEDSSRFMCDICGRTFMYKSNLEAHSLTHEEGRQFICNVCGKSFKTQATLYSHALVHKTETPYSCSTCGKGFKSKDRVAAHEKRHSGLKPHVCEICRRGFPDKGGLTKHRKTVHTDFKRFMCQICGKSCSRADNLRVHMKIHGEENMTKITTLPIPDENPDLSHFVSQGESLIRVAFGGTASHQLDQNASSGDAMVTHEAMTTHETINTRDLIPATDIDNTRGMDPSMDQQQSMVKSQEQPGTVQVSSASSGMHSQQEFINAATGMLYMQAFGVPFGNYSGFQ
ncbi:zinc finger protein 665 [Lingula anatina]|uniref:Zinc finger protein 665 n=1 Tax=Lingula anatina TaxID=7574 RepID=A0A1S3IGA4_LINAN|nr:zinc finger protein 665 [Lingula anatina]|eukprot:XP_013397168.1 zinc finger protein 665 [Lingula anatina]